MRIALLPALLAVSACSLSHAADSTLAPRPLTVGDRARVHGSAGVLGNTNVSRRSRVGTISSIEPDTLRLEGRRHEGTIAIPTASIERVDVSDGNRPRSEGALLGGVGGLLLGVFVGLTASDVDLPRSLVIGATGGIGAAVGSVVGAIVGGPQRWVPATLSNTPSTPGSGPAGWVRTPMCFGEIPFLGIGTASPNTSQRGDATGILPWVRSKQLLSRNRPL